MIFRNPFKGLSRFEWILWSLSIVIVSGSFFLSGGFYLLSLIVSLVGVTALIFIARGDVWGQLLTVLFSLLYAVVSFRFRYYGEMITYLGMTAPIAVLSVISWLKHPYSGTTEVKVNQLNSSQRKQIILATLVVTFVFYFILAYFNTTNLLISTLSIATSFSASFLMLYRSPVYALAFGVNDVVLIVLWILASIDDLSYLPMVACFIMFLLNDIYGFTNWVRMRKRQQE